MKKPIVNEDDPKFITVWTDPRGCSSCKHCSMDMDMDPYCSHPILKNSYPQGLELNSAIHIFCGNPHTLWRKK